MTRADSVALMVVRSRASVGAGSSQVAATTCTSTVNCCDGRAQGGDAWKQTASVDDVMVLVPCESARKSVAFTPSAR